MTHFRTTMMEFIRSIPRNKEKWFILLKLIVSVWLVSYLSQRIGTVNLWQVLISADIWPMLLALLLMVPNIFLQITKFSILSDKLLPGHDKNQLKRGFFIGIMMGSFTPGRLGEYLGRKLALKNEGLLEISMATFIDKVFNLFFISGIGALVLTIYLYVNIAVPVMAVIALFVSISILVFILLHLMLSESWWNNSIVRFMANFKLLKKYKERFLVLKQLNRGLINRLAVFSGLIYFITLLQYGLLVVSFSGGSNVVEYMWAGALFLYTKSFIPAFTWGEIGVREAVSIFYLTSFGLSEAVGFNTSLLLFLINLFLPSIPGFWYLLKNR